jgi:hypothetical protein
MKITKVYYSPMMNQWYITIDKNIDIKTTESEAKLLIDRYRLEEVNMFRFEAIGNIIKF